MRYRVRLGVRRVFEVDDRIDVAIKHGIRKELVCGMRHACIRVLSIGMTSRFQESAEKGRAGGPVKAVVVVENANFHQVSSETIGKPISMLQSGYKNQP